jgi:hypothetical protein
MRTREEPRKLSLAKLCTLWGGLGLGLAELACAGVERAVGLVTVGARERWGR